MENGETHVKHEARERCVRILNIAPMPLTRHRQTLINLRWSAVWVCFFRCLPSESVRKNRWCRKRTRQKTKHCRCRDFFSSFFSFCNVIFGCCCLPVGPVYFNFDIYFFCSHLTLRSFVFIDAHASKLQTFCRFCVFLCSEQKWIFRIKSFFESIFVSRRMHKQHKPRTEAGARAKNRMELKSVWHNRIICSNGTCEPSRAFLPPQNELKLSRMLNLASHFTAIHRNEPFFTVVISYPVSYVALDGDGGKKFSEFGKCNYAIYPHINISSCGLCFRSLELIRHSLKLYPVFVTSPTCLSAPILHQN